MTKLQQAAQRAIATHGGLRPAARALGIDHAYLYRLRHGLKKDPSVALLARLGLERKIVYREASQCATPARP